MARWCHGEEGWRQAIRRGPRGVIMGLPERAGLDKFPQIRCQKCIVPEARHPEPKGRVFCWLRACSLE
jgi:hypothetical protein